MGLRRRTLIGHQVIRCGPKPRLSMGIGPETYGHLVRSLKEERIRALGLEPFTTASRACACGKPALRVWENVGWCKQCYRETTSKGHPS